MGFGWCFTLPPRRSSQPPARPRWRRSTRTSGERTTCWRRRDSSPTTPRGSWSRPPTTCTDRASTVPAPRTRPSARPLHMRPRRHAPTSSPARTPARTASPRRSPASRTSTEEGDLNWSRIVPDTVRALTRGDRPVIASDGTPERDYLYVEDAVDAYLAIADSLADPANYGRAWNVGCDRPVSVLGARTSAHRGRGPRSRARGSRHPGAWESRPSVSGLERDPRRARMACAGGRSMTASRRLTSGTAKRCGRPLFGDRRRDSGGRARDATAAAGLVEGGSADRRPTGDGLPRRAPSPRRLRRGPRRYAARQTGRDRELPAPPRGRDRGDGRRRSRPRSWLGSTGSTTATWSRSASPTRSGSPADGFRRLVELVEAGAGLALGLFRTASVERPDVVEVTGSEPDLAVTRIDVGSDAPPPHLVWGCAVGRASVMRRLRDLGRSWRSVQRALPGRTGRGRRPVVELLRCRDSKGNAHRTSRRPGARFSRSCRFRVPSVRTGVKLPLLR